MFLLKKSFHFNEFFPNNERRKMEKCRRCEICYIDVHGASYAKYLASKKHLEKMRQNEKKYTRIVF